MTGADNYDRRRLLGAAAMTIAGARLGLYHPLARSMNAGSSHVRAANELASLRTAAAWINSGPITAAELLGKVVLIDIWTYTCINWLRTLPYVRAWAEKYKSQGLVVIGVHSPEFPFEHDLENVRRAVKDMRVDYPVAIDNSFSIWRAFDNHYWPALYLIDARSRIRFQHFGEGEYERTERTIQELLADAGAGGVDRELVSVAGQGVEAAADWSNLRSPENYVGYERTENFASPGGASLDERRVFAIPPKLKLNQWALSGDWTIKQKATVSNVPNARIACRFHGRDLHLVMGPAARTAPVRFRVLLDGMAPRVAHGSDVDEQGYGTLADQRLYQLIRQPMPIVERQFEIEFLVAGAEAYAFTFG